MIFRRPPSHPVYPALRFALCALRHTWRIEYNERGDKEEGVGSH